MGQSTDVVFKTKFTIYADNEPENMAPDVMGQCLMEHTSSCVLEHPKWVNTTLAYPGRLAAADVHKSPMSVRDRQVDACSQPLPKLLYRRGANIAARGDSLLLLFSLSLTQSHVVGKRGASG